MNVLEKILEEIEEAERIRFSKYTEPLIAIKDVEKIIRLHMDEAIVSNHDDKWIPVEDGLPEEKMEVLCCFENGTVQSLWQNWKNDGLGDYFDDDLIPTEVIAWQPLPERYKGDSNA